MCCFNLKYGYFCDMLKSKNPNYEAYVRLKIERNKFMQLIGFQIDEIREGEVNGTMPVKEMHEQQNGFVHGGIISSLSDMACGFAAYSLVEEGVQVFTIEIKVSYLRPGIGQEIKAKGWVLKAGKQFINCESELYAVNDSESKLIAKASSTMAVIDRAVNDKYGD